MDCLHIPPHSRLLRIFKILLQIVYDVINDLVGGHDILQEVKKAVTGIVDAISSIF